MSKYLFVLWLNNDETLQYTCGDMAEGYEWMQNMMEKRMLHETLYYSVHGKENEMIQEGTIDGNDIKSHHRPLYFALIGENEEEPYLKGKII